jgi:hypothetical protein
VACQICTVPSLLADAIRVLSYDQATLCTWSEWPGDFRVQDLDGCLRFQIDVFTEVDIGEAPLPKEVDEAVVPELLR